MPTTHSPITPTDHSPLIAIAVYFLMVTFILAVIIRFAIRLGIARSLGQDDWVCFASMVVGIGQSIAVAIGIRDGLGKFESHLSSNQITKILKAQYTSSYFYIVALGLSKISVLLLLTRLAVSRLHKRIALYTAYFTGAWTIAAMVSLGARCGAQLPWTVSNSSAAAQCINIKTFWIAITPFDILIELVIIITPIAMMIPVQVAVGKKLVIIFAFVSRLLVIACSITRLFFLLPHTPSSNFTFLSTNAEILTQVVLSVSITSACIPCLKPFIDAFASGQMAVTFKNGVPGSHSNGNSYPMQDLAYANNLAYGSKGGGGTTSRIEANADAEDEDDSIVAAKYGVKRIATDRTAGEVSAEREDSGSVASDSKSDQMIIKKDVQWTVSYEDVENRNDEKPLSHEPQQAGTSEQRVAGRSLSRMMPSNHARRDEDSGDEQGSLGHRHRRGSLGYAV